MKAAATVYYAFHAYCNSCEGRNFALHPPWKSLCSHFPSFFPMQLSYLVEYSLINILLQKLRKASLCSSLTLQTCSHRRICRGSFSGDATVSVLLSFAYCSMKKPTMMGSLCSMDDFSNSTCYKSFATLFSLLNSGSLIDLWVFISCRYL